MLLGVVIVAATLGVLVLLLFTPSGTHEVNVDGVAYHSCLAMYWAMNAPWTIVTVAATTIPMMLLFVTFAYMFLRTVNVVCSGIVLSAVQGAHVNEVDIVI